MPCAVVRAAWLNAAVRPLCVVLEFRVSGFGFRVSGLGVRNSGLGFRVSDFRFRVSGFGFRISGFGVHTDNAASENPSHSGPPFLHGFHVETFIIHKLGGNQNY